MSVIAFPGGQGRTLGAPSPEFPSPAATPQEVCDLLIASIYRDAPSEDHAHGAIIMALLTVAKGYRREKLQ